MDTSRTQQSSAIPMAMLCAGAVTAQFIAGKATRDAMILDQLAVTTLPIVVVAASICSIGLVFLSAKTLHRVSPSAFVPLTFVLSALLFIGEWMLFPAAPRAAAFLVYLHVSGLGPMLGSGFWLIATERFDPRTAKQRFGQIAGVGTLSGLLGGLLAERVAVTMGIAAMLPILAVVNALCAWSVRMLAPSDEPDARRRRQSADVALELAPESATSGLRVLAEASYLRNLAALVLLGAIAAACIDYLFKVQAVAAFGNGQTLLRFFAIYYGVTSLITFVVQTSCSRVSLEKLGLAVTTGMPSLALAVTGLIGVFAPGLQAVMVARGAESVARGSLFRAAYELFYTPIPAKEKRAAKSLIDVGFDRLGEAMGGGLVRLLLLAPLAIQYNTIMLSAVVCSVVALLVASRLNRGYIETLERSLLHRAVELELSDVGDNTTRTALMRTIIRPLSASRVTRLQTESTPPPSTTTMATQASSPRGLDADLLQVMALRSKDRDRILRVLQSDDGLPGLLVPHVIPLLAWDPVANASIDALRKVAEEHIGELVDALIDPNQDFAVRRRLARVFAVCVSQRAADGLLLGLDDLRFEVRFQCGRSLASIVEKNPRIRVDREKVLDVVLREVAVGRPVWESHQLLDRLEDTGPSSFVDDFLKDRASRSLSHVFALLSLVLPAEPLQIAFRGLHTDDQNLRGTALEYLEGVLPPQVRDRLWPFLEDTRAARGSPRSRDEIVADLLRSNESIVVNLEELKRRVSTSRTDDTWQRT